MKNIFLIDRGCTIIDSIMEIEDLFISVLVVDSKEIKEKILSKYKDRIGHVYITGYTTYDDFFTEIASDYNLTYDDINNYIIAHHKTYRHLHREILDHSEIDYRYYLSLRFWLGIFEKYRIDILFSMSVEHGILHDSIPFEIAKNKGIQVYINTIMFWTPKEKAYSIFHLNKNSYILLDEFSANKTNISNYIHNPNSIIKLNQHNKLKINKNFIKEQIKKLRPKHFSSESQNKYFNVFNLSDQFIKKYIKELQKLKKFYNKNTLNNYNPNVKYIYYSLHFEPEGAILNRVTLSNQLFIIRILSENLPDGWKLFVKEHPNQFSIYEKYPYYLNGINYFKTEQFYLNIIRNKNTYLIDLKINSQKLITNACAVATINGTVAIESISINKPVLLFGGNSTIFCLINDVFNINSISSLKNALCKINSEFIPSYDNCDEIMSKYLYETNDIPSNENKLFIKELCTLLLKEK